MKRNLFYIVIILFLQSFQIKTENEIESTAALGKTHFISGYDHTKVRQSRAKKKRDKKNEEELEIFFSPLDDVCTKLCEFIAQEQECIRVAIYTLTDDRVRDALIKAHKKGVRVEVITEKTMILERYSKIDDLADVGIIIYAYPVNKNEEKIIRGIMHNKFMIFSRNAYDQKIVWLGSYNFTKAAHKHNRESVVVLKNNHAYTSFVQEFDTIKQLSKQYLLRI